MSTQSNAELSKVIYDALDCIGYSKESVNSRAEFWRQAYLTNQPNFRKFLTRICAGSRDEGTARLFESDLDVMIVHENYLCVDHGKIEEGLAVIQTDTTDCPPGYTKLIPLEMNRDFSGPPLISSIIVYDIQKGHHFLSTGCCMNHLRDMLKGNLKYLEARNKFWQQASCQSELKQSSGPSIPVSFTVVPGNTLFHSVESDCVFAIPYFSATILETWKERCREYEWLSRDAIKEVSTMEGFVVPVGHRKEQDLEWRISYITAEQKLVSCFSSLQLKVYVLMKMIFKEIVSQECNIITSYMVKNVIFWISERYGNDVSTKENLIDFLQYGLMFMINCLNSNLLPNYMTPKRNLLLGKTDICSKNKLRQILRELLHERGVFVFQLKELGAAMNTFLRDPVLGKLKAKFRKAAENYFFLTWKKCSKKFSQVAHFFRQVV